MLPFGELLPGTLVRRDNRFRARVRIGDRTVDAHVPNSGRLKELLFPGADCYVSPNPTCGKTSHVVRLVDQKGTLISIDARLPSALLADAWQRGVLAAPMKDFHSLRREVTRGASRLDMLLTDRSGARQLWVETKSVTLVGTGLDGLPRGVAVFPDAPTTRGLKHLQELTGAMVSGAAAAVVFVVQRPDARAFCPHPTSDPAFLRALAAAAESGVHVRAYGCSVTLAGIALDAPLPVSYDCSTCSA